MLGGGRLLLYLTCLGVSFSAWGLTELELQKLQIYSMTPTMLPSATLDKVFIDLNAVQVPRIENTTPLSIQEYRSQLKQRLALQLNTKWQIGLDSFKACPLDKQVIDWPESTKPKGSKSSSSKGYGLGIRMKLD